MNMADGGVLKGDGVNAVIKLPLLFRCMFGRISNCRKHSKQRILHLLDSYVYIKSVCGVFFFFAQEL